MMVYPSKKVAAPMMLRAQKTFFVTGRRSSRALMSACPSNAAGCASDAAVPLSHAGVDVTMFPPFQPDCFCGLPRRASGANPKRPMCILDVLKIAPIGAGAAPLGKRTRHHRARRRYLLIGTPPG